MLTSVLLAATLSPAHACGGLFCNSAQPVVQNAERIVFNVDEETGYVETHVQIFYEGPADEFAWVVPVPSVPELFNSTQTLFDNLGTRTGPIFQLNTIFEGNCDSRSGNVALSSAPDSASSAPPSSPGSTVVVVSEGRVGPYDTQVLQANSNAALTTYLEENGYDLPAELDAVLDPYVSAEAYFVALKLGKDSDAGDIAPLGMRYQSDRAMIPIQLTSVAAAEDMRLEVYVFAEHRAVPKSYLHVQINEAAIDWWTNGSNYSDVITQAADEAGGHAFATDYFGPSATFAQTFDLDTTGLRTAKNAIAWVEGIRDRGFPQTEELANVIADAVDLPADIDAIDFMFCPTCYADSVDWDPNAFDPEIATDDLEDRVVEPLERAEDLFDQPLLTRMTSSLDAIEMTVDPVFVLNPDLSDTAHEVPQNHSADLVIECGDGGTSDTARRRLELSDGRVLDMPGAEYLRASRTTEFDYLAEHGATRARIIEQMSESGEPEVLFDYTDELFALADAHNEALKLLLDGAAACGGCSATGGGGLAGSAGLIGLLGLATLRRRRS